MRALESRGGRVLLVVGELMLVAGLGLFLFGKKEGGAVAIVGLFLLLTGWVTSKQGERAAHLRIRGIRARGRILKAVTTSIKSDGICRTTFDLEVTPPDGEPYSISTTQRMSVAEGNGLTANSEVWVRVDPKDHRRVLVELP